MNHQKWLKYPGSKWLKHQIMHQDSKLKLYLPETYPLSQPALEKLLKRYETVYLKPSLGGGGRGILRVRQKNNRYVLEGARSEKRFYESIQRLYRYILHRVKSRNYIVQQGIHLLQFNGRPLDFRCLIYKKDENWVYIGMMGKVAQANSFTTNLCRGGQAITFNKALNICAGFNEKQSEKMENKLKHLGLSAAKRLNQYFPYITELGLDIALDSQHHCWILEANTKPRFELFKKHEDPSLYSKISRDLKLLRSRPIHTQSAME